MNDNTWVLVRYSGLDQPVVTGYLGYVQAMTKQRWEHHSRTFSPSWEVIAEGTEEEMMALEKVNRS
jgi:hypothetical protein